MKTLTACPHVRYAVEPNGRVVVQTLSPGGSVNEQRRFRSMKQAHKAFENNVYCGRRGAAFLPTGKNRSDDLFWAQSRMNGLAGVPRFRDGDCVVVGRKTGVVVDTRRGEMTVRYHDGGSDRYVSKSDARRCGSSKRGGGR